MNRVYFSSLLALGFSLFACRKQKPNPEPVIPQSVFLKEIILSNLPSPYYHFDYDASGGIQKAGFASGQFNYTVQYNGRRINEVKNTSLGNNDRLQYVYENDKLV